MASACPVYAVVTRMVQKMRSVIRAWVFQLARERGSRDEEAAESSNVD